MAEKKKLSAEERNRTLVRLLKYCKPLLPVAAGALLLAAVSIVAAHFIPVLVGDAIDLALGKGQVDMPGILKILSVIPLLAVLSALFDWLVRIAGTRLSAAVTRDIRADCIRKIERLPLSYLDSHRTGDTLSRMIADVDRMSEGLLTGITELYSSVLSIIVTLVFMLVINYKVALVVALLTPLSMLVAGFIAKRTFSLFREQSVLAARQTAIIDESVAGMGVVKAYSRENALSEDFEKLNEEYRRTATRAVFYSSITNPATRFVNSLVYCGVALAGGLMAVANPLVTAGEISCLLYYAHSYAKPFNELSGVIAELQSALACASRVFELLDTPDEPSDAPDAVDIDPAKVKGAIRADNVGFSYTDKPFMSGIDFDVKQGMRVAVVGPTGCGKTTLINLFMRFYETDAGTITVDGRSIRNITRGSLRASFGMVLQDTWLKSGTVRENIAMGKPDATDAEIEAAARASHAHSFIKRLPQGYDTVLSEDGSQLSQGQKQLLCISRVMLALPPMLILDEATSSIDTRTEIKIQKAFAELMRGRTSFIVAHRLNTIKNADLILVMKDGKIIERGTHDELMSAGGFYADLYGAQFRSVENV
ncbi:MAG TPA: sugar ABC transporter ATP-binding protein [Clostridiales bacterium]|nr:sugar ABC transporter ATP-binding protein [Clostridiales bacterium]